MFLCVKRDRSAPHSSPSMRNGHGERKLRHREHPGDCLLDNPSFDHFRVDHHVAEVDRPQGNQPGLQHIVHFTNPIVAIGGAFADKDGVAGPKRRDPQVDARS